ncbi:MAG: hypothetical protein LBJ88_04205 [Campylobacteraceae bacterium]|jgi:hypothetical protein|nr:hypothetical protein [Campylobacteraceae bacterium]
MDIYNTLYKEQFRLKLGFTYLLASGWALCFLVVIVFMNMSLEKSASIYIFGLTLIYKYVFSMTRDGFHYEPFFYKKLSKLLHIIRKRA